MNIRRLNKIFFEIGLELKLSDISLTLPIAHNMRYDLKEVKINNELVCLLIQEKRAGSVETFIDQAESISKKSGIPYILIFSEIDKDIQKSLLKARVPFLDYKGNFYIPQLGILLHKHLTTLNREKFSPSEQLIFINLMLKSNSFIKPEIIENETGVSIPTIYRTLKKFSELEWITSYYGSYTFARKKNDILQDANELLINPIKRTVYLDNQSLHILETNRTGKLLVAGTTALSQMTMLDDSSVTFALSNKEFNRIRKNEMIDFIKEPILDYKEIQLWQYEPIEGKNSLVDPISLYLSLKNADDPRIDIELSKLKKVIVKLMEENNAS